MVAGFETPTAGAIRIDGKDVTDLRPNQRNVGMVFQSYALFPNMTVAQNVAFGLKVAKRPAAEIAARVEEMLELIKLPQLGGRYPFQLSGGQQQRVALARALADQAAGAAARRAAVGARRQDPRLAARGNPRDPARARHHHDLRDPRPGRSAVDVRPHRGDERGPGRADRHAVRDLQPPAHALRRLLRRHAQHPASGRVVDAAGGRIAIDDQEIVAARGIVDAEPGEIRSVALRPEAVVAGRRRRRRATSMRGTIEEVSFLGAVVRIRVRFKENAISLDTFNNPGVAAARARPAGDRQLRAARTCWCSRAVEALRARVARRNRGSPFSLPAPGSAAPRPTFRLPADEAFGLQLDQVRQHATAPRRR